MQTIPANIQIIENPALELPDTIEIKFNGMFPKQEYIVVVTNFGSDSIDNFNVDHASALQKNIIEKVLELRHPSLDAVPLVRKVSFNKDNNTWRIEIFSIKIKNFGDTIPSRIKDCFDKAMEENEGIKINWGIRL
jgi:hypothetical protein